MKQRCTRYFLLLNLFGFFFVSAQALAAEEPVDSCGDGICALSCSNLDVSPGFSFDWQPILGAVVARANLPSILPETPFLGHSVESDNGVSPLPILAVAPKQSPPHIA